MKAFIAFGSNVEDRINYILKAIELLQPCGKILKISTIYESAPWGVSQQPSFLNGVLLLETSFDPIKLLFCLKDVERLAGRRERYRWGPREIDLDIILYENNILFLSFLTIPHPYMTERDFVLVPLLELDPNLQHPITRVPLEDYLKKLKVNLKPFACLYPPVSSGH
ncbi:2-amino-4-hydroxy-6-hydroxymethyldihydropteridin epyrophosphokinase [Thermocrinis albus DSM 14484]|uniref:2-amino-4-hydroxy-6-hydroxymethyldihydropteridine pyrophosphokinase n=1 Tax=Thermocrinis albus (strain DSM 14484 / JCM 11386 / HI 11/12) TaxID=638303 RepID=D3SMU3_THEAH|nr:2-amino-4-hydroxy-6-hydroxymethyldihydropteridine diphosphokinase [Thermocrinis albus]ADC90073.1 2-amino-4-hydroxy-6-hydroxymethyldihydropteridin epyrophosphokinase [Thermocrinis albus DSM 14484]